MRTYAGLGKQTLGGHKQNLVHTKIQEKRAVSTQETDPDLPVTVQETPAEAWIGVVCSRVRGTECSSACMGHFEGGHHYPHYLHQSLASGQTTGREHSPENCIKDLLSMDPPIRTGPSFPPQSVSPNKKLP